MPNMYELQWGTQSKLQFRVVLFHFSWCSSLVSTTNFSSFVSALFFSLRIHFLLIRYGFILQNLNRGCLGAGSGVVLQREVLSTKIHKRRHIEIIIPNEYNFAKET